MNLLAKIYKGAILLLPLCMISCSSSDDLGLELNPGQSGVDVLYAEFDLPVNTFYIDSLRTDLGTNILLGGHRDDLYGSIQSTSYAEFDYQGGTLPADTLDVISAILRLPISDILSVESAFTFDVEVRALTDTIFSSVVYLSDDEIPAFDTVLDTWTIDVEPGDSTVSLSLSDELRQQLWFRSFDTDNIGDIQFGIQMASNTTEGIVALNIFDEDAQLDVISRDPSDSTFSTSYVLRNHFHNIRQDRSGSQLEALENTGDTLSGGEVSYISLLAGAYSRVDLGPYLRFVESSENIIINKADLEVSLGAGSPNTNTDDVSSFFFYFFKDGSIINGPGIVDNFPNTLMLEDLEYSDFAAQRTIRRITLEEDGTSYEDAVTLFVQSLLEDNRNGEDYLTEGLVTVPTNALSLEQTALLKNGVKLRVFYTSTN